MVLMETNSPVEYQENTDRRFSPADNKKTPQLNAEELRILRICNEESFYYRCLPFSAIGVSGTYLLFKRGILTGHPKWGPAIKMTGAAVAGWVLGKLSYRSKCEDKFLNVENSVIGNAVRKKRGYIVERFDSEQNQFSSDDNYSLRDNYTHYSSGDFHSSSGSLNFDRNAPSLELDDRDRPSLDSNSSNLENNQPTRPSTTYDELRRRNREEYEKQQYRPTQVPTTDTYRRPWNPPSNEQFRRSQDDTAKNAYGDSWDNPKFT